MEDAARRGVGLLARVLLVSLAACADPRAARVPQPVPLEPARDPLFFDPLDVERLAAQVSAYRGLAVRAPARLVLLEEDRGMGAPGSGAAPGVDTDGLLHAFGLTRTNESIAAEWSTTFGAGFIYLFEPRIWLLGIRGYNGDDERARDWMLVHEVEHSLQDPSLLERAGRLDGDEALALRAVLEGDADVTSAAFMHARERFADHWLAELVARGRERLTNPRAFGGRSTFVRRQLFFPYVEGTQFVGTMYRTGGYALVNGVLEHPPASTEQVLHPEKYLAGEQPVPVPIPVAPPGYTRVAGGCMGELRTRALLEQCDAPQDEPAPFAWGGDAFAVVSDSSGSLAVLWSTVWDDDGAAVRFETRLDARQECMRRPLGARAETGARTETLGARAVKLGETTVVRDGAKVAYVQGLTPQLRATAARELLALPGSRPVPVPPLGEVHLRPLVDPRSFLAKGRLIGDRYVSEPLGLSVSMRGFKSVDPRQFRERAELAAEARDGSRLGLVLILPLFAPLTREVEQRMVSTVLPPLVSYRPAFEGPESFVTGAGPARAFRLSMLPWERVAIVFVPVCEGKMTLVALADGQFDVMSEAQRWLQSLRFDDASPACRFAGEDGP
jgi:hypothetical protein